MTEKITITINKDWLGYILQGLIETRQAPEIVYRNEDDRRRGNFHVAGNITQLDAIKYFEKLILKQED